MNLPNLRLTRNDPAADDASMGREAFGLMRDAWDQETILVQESLSDERSEPVVRRPLRRSLVVQTVAKDAVGLGRRSGGRCNLTIDPPQPLDILCLVHPEPGWWWMGRRWMVWWAALGPFVVLLQTF